LERENVLIAHNRATTTLDRNGMNGNDYRVAFAGTGELTPAVVERCLVILERGGAVDIPSARRELPLAPLVVLVRHRETVVGLGAIKRIRENYAADKAMKSGAPFDPKTAEFGYVAVDDDHQGHGLSKAIANLLLEKNTETLFGTTYNEVSPAPRDSNRSDRAVFNPIESCLRRQEGCVS
jgi:hypothetical protein